MMKMLHVIKNLLAQRGIGKELINTSLLSLTEEKEAEAAVQFVKKKMKSLRQYSHPVVRRKLWGMLQRRGFSRDIINSALRFLEDLR
jgi:SOS response regulatory protein OraA/RecX